MFIRGLLMMIITKRIILYVLVMLASSLVVHAQDAAKPLTIGFAQVGSESAWRKAFTAATEAEAQKRGINLVFVDSENSQEKEIAALRSFIEQKVDAIILAPVVETGWDTVIKEINDAKIPLVIIDR